MKIIVVGSGSKGNCYYIENGNTRILIDAGLSYKKVNEAIGDVSINGIFITHEHSDHINSLKVVANKYKTEVYLTEKTFDGISNKEFSYSFIESKDTIKFDDMIVESIPIFHDARDPVGYIIYCKDKKVVFITDTGYVHNSLLKKISNADVYIVEANHDPDVLMNSERPYELKRRILGDRGHMCNEDSAVLLCDTIGVNTKAILHAHISLECNLEELIIQTMKNIFAENKLDYNNYITKCLRQNEVYILEV